MTILITGGTGFVGVNLVRYYAMRGDRVVSLDAVAPDAPVEQFVNGLAGAVSFSVGDVRDGGLLQKLVTDNDVQRIIHAAAITPDILREQSNPYEILDVNFMSIARVLDVARNSPTVKRTLVISSAAVYGVKPEDQPLHEADAVAPKNLYAITKYSGELLVERYRELFNLDAGVARLGWIYGPMERETASTRGLSTVTRLLNLMRRGKRARMVGAEAVRDWTHAEDVARATAALLEAPQLPDAVYNVSGGRGYTNLELAETLRACYPTSEYEFVREGQENVPDNLKNRRSYLDIERIQKQTGFVPQYDLKTGLVHL